MNRTLTSETTTKVGQEITLQGWVCARRDHGGMIFFDLRDRAGKIQCVASTGVAGFEEAKNLNSEDVIEINGIVKERPEQMVNKKLTTGGVEIEIKTIKVLSKAETLPFDMGNEKLTTGIETTLDYRPLSLRHSSINPIFKIQEIIVNSFRNFLTKNAFTEFQAPKIINADAEGGATVMSVDYLGYPAALAQSPQLYKQILVGVFERVYTVGNVFRGEPHATTRHLNEYTSLDFEMGFIKNMHDVMDMEEDWLKQLAQELKGKVPEILIPEKFPRIEMDEVLRLYKEATGIDDTNEPDLAPQHERFISEYVKEKFQSDFVFVTHYSLKRAFYTMVSEDQKHTESFDLIFRGVEITSGAQREHRVEKIIENLQRKNIKPEAFAFYLQAFRYGMPPHGGIGFGLERMTQKLLGLDNVQEATLFPRVLNRIDLPVSRKQNNNGEEVFSQIKRLLDREEIKYQVTDHKEVKTSAESAEVRGVPLSWGAKAMVLVADNKPLMVVVPADKKIDFKKLPAGTKLASAEEVIKFTNCEVGAVPPFGNLFNIPMYIDNKLNETIDFNAGLRTRSIQMSLSDYKRVVEGQEGEWTQ